MANLPSLFDDYNYSEGLESADIPIPAAAAVPATSSEELAFLPSWKRALVVRGINDELFNNWIQTVRLPSTTYNGVLHHTFLVAAVASCGHTNGSITNSNDNMIDAVDEFGWSALHHAASTGSREAIRAILTLGGNVDLRSTRAAQATLPSGRPYHITGREVPERKFPVMIPRGSSPLHVAVRFEQFESITTLLAATRFIFVDGIDDTGESAVICALLRHNMRIVRSLVTYGADTQPAFALLAKQSSDEEAKLVVSRREVADYEARRALDPTLPHRWFPTRTGNVAVEVITQMKRVIGEAKEAFPKRRKELVMEMINSPPYFPNVLALLVAYYAF
jgi:hypothetical protein